MIDPNLITTVRTGELPASPFSLTDKIAHEVGVDLKQSTIQELITFMTPFIGAIQFQVITLHVDAAYIADNFDGTGLGTNLMLGYAIVNGQNGTINKDGRTGIAYGAVYNAVGAIGGATTHLLTVNEIPPHKHDLPTDTAGSQDLQSLMSNSGSDEGFDGNNLSAQTGGGQAHNNMQPYLVELQVMKL